MLEWGILLILLEVAFWVFVGRLGWKRVSKGVGGPKRREGDSPSDK